MSMLSREEISEQARFGKKINEVRKALRFVESAYRGLSEHGNAPSGRMCDLEIAIDTLRDALPSDESECE